MNKQQKKLVTTLILLALITTLMTQIPKTASAESTVREKALTAIKEIIGIDSNNYDTKLTSYLLVNPAMTADQGKSLGNAQKEIVSYAFKSTEEDITVECNFINGTLMQLGINSDEGVSLSSLQLPSKLTDATKIILQRLQTYSGSSYFQPMLAMLNNVSEVKNLEIIKDNLKLKISVAEPYYTDFAFKYTSHGVDYPKIIHVAFNKENLAGIIDQWNLYTVGSENLKISRDVAIRIAQEQAEKNGSFVTFTDGTIAKYNLTGVVDAHIGSAVREPWTAYPFWGVQLYTDIYRGKNQIQVGIWADTGIIEYCYAVGSMGGGSPQPTNPSIRPLGPAESTLPSSDQQEISTNAPQIDTIIIVAFVVAIVAISISLAVLRKRKQ